MQELLQKIANVLADGNDHPEIWNLLSGAARPDGGAGLRPFLRHLEALCALPQADQVMTLLRVIRAIVRAGVGELEAAYEDLSQLQLANSQSALVAGALFHVESLLHPEDARYRLKDKVCLSPFIQLDVLEDSTHQCCASWLHRSAGNLKTTPWRQVWNSDAAQQVRASVLDGSYRFCNKSLCPFIQGQTLVPKAELRERSEFWRGIVDEGRTELAQGPEVVNLAYDRTCNLSCPSCRTEKIAANTAQREIFFDMQDRNILPMLKTAKIAYVTGSGDPFASKNFRRLLQSLNAGDYPELKLQIMTNGMLLTRVEWEKFPGLKGRVAMLKISIDGARKDSHELLRRGSHWETMLENLRFMGEVRARGEVDMFELVFVVQQENYREMGEAVDLAREVGADRVYFARISNWGTFAPGEFARKAVFAPGHPEHAAFLEAMADPRLRDPHALLPDLVCFLPEAVAAPVEDMPAPEGAAPLEAEACCV